MPSSGRRNVSQALKPWHGSGSRAALHVPRLVPLVGGLDRYQMEAAGLT
jgi:hypothetical protein